MKLEIDIQLFYSVRRLPKMCLFSVVGALYSYLRYKYKNSQYWFY